MNLSLIVAKTTNNVIGHNNKLLWHLPKDLQHFKKTTFGHSIIMGRKTFESIGKPLPGRINIVLTTNNKKKFIGCKTANSPQDALKLVKNDSEPFIIGGSEIYKLFFKDVNKMYITQLNTSMQGNAVFPKYDTKKWNVVDEIYYKKDDQNPFDFTIVTLSRNCF